MRESKSKRAAAAKEENEMRSKKNYENERDDVYFRKSRDRAGPKCGGHLLHHVTAAILAAIPNTVPRFYTLFSKIKRIPPHPHQRERE
jgi:hypothetical protein